MTKLLDLYKSDQGDAVKQNGNTFNGPCPFCGGRDRFIVWPDRESQGGVCSEQGIRGVWSCRQCGKNGDTIAFMMEVSGLTFREALAELGVQGGKSRRQSTPLRPRQTRRSSFEPKNSSAPARPWTEYATKLLEEARDTIRKKPAALEWLARRGLDLPAVERYGLGYLEGEKGKTGRFRDRSALGLPPKTGRDGKEKKNLFIPRGIVIPAFDSSGTVNRLRIRRPKPDIATFGDKYMVLEGSAPSPAILEPSSGSRHLAVYVVVEAELDMMLIHHATDRMIGAFASLTNRGKPEAGHHEILLDSSRLLVALDYDTPKPVTKPDGSVVMESAGANGWLWWRDNYPNAKRWPTPAGKDPGEAYSAGVNILEWIAAGLPPSISLSNPATVGGLSSGLFLGGEGENQQIDKKPRWTVPPELLELETRMREVPGFAFVKHTDGNGFGFRCNAEWARSSAENWETARSLENAIVGGLGWDYLVNHPADHVTIHNLLAKS